jgi:hypothetical protein
MQNYFSLVLPKPLWDHDFNKDYVLDHIVSRFELFGQWFSSQQDFQKCFPLKQMYIVIKFYHIVAPPTHGDHALNKIDSTPYQEALV